MDDHKNPDSRPGGGSHLLSNAEEKDVFLSRDAEVPVTNPDETPDVTERGIPLAKFNFKSTDFDLTSVQKKMQTFDLKSSKFKKALNASDPLRRVNSMYSPKSVYEELQLVRRVKLPKSLTSFHHVLQEFDDSGEDLSQLAQVEKYLPYIANNKLVKIEPQLLYSEPNSSISSGSSGSNGKDQYSPLPSLHTDSFLPSFNSKDHVYSPKMRIGLILSGGPAPGGHNVIAGVFDYLKFRNPESRLIGFIGGLDGLKYKRYHVISEEIMDQYRNLGGFNMLLSGRGMISSKQEFDMVVKTITELDLDGLIIVGGDGSNSNAANISNYLAHYYSTLSSTPSSATAKDADTPLDTVSPTSSSRSKSIQLDKSKRCAVVGVPKTVDGDIRSKNIEITFGFDTAARTYSELIGNLCTDAVSTQYNYHFVRIMGRSASHLALECALQTHPNMLLVSEEVAKKNISLEQIVDDIVDLIEKRYQMGKTYGVVLIPEGLVEFIPDFKVLVHELNQILGTKCTPVPNEPRTSFDFKARDFDINLLHKSKKTWQFLPQNIQEQLLNDIESTGCILVAKIATEDLLSMLVQAQIVTRNLTHLQDIEIMTHYFGYEGRCAIPSEFDSSYCYSLGYTASVLISHKKNGYMAAIRGLKNSVEDWVPLGIPFTNLTTLSPTGAPPPLVPLTSRDLQNDTSTEDSVSELSTPASKLTDSDMTINLDKRVRCSIKKTLLDLDDELFKSFERVRDIWAFADLYRNPGPIQIANPNPSASSTNFTRYLESYTNLTGFDTEDSSNYSQGWSTLPTNDEGFEYDVQELNDRRCYTLKTPTMDELLGDYPFEGEPRNLVMKDKSFMSDLEKARLQVVPELPVVCVDTRAKMIPFKQYFESDQYVKNQIMLHYPYQHKINHFNQYELVLNNPIQSLASALKEGVVCKECATIRNLSSMPQLPTPENKGKTLKIGVLPVGKHAPGVLNVFWGIYERTKKMGGKCYAFHGVKGVIEKSYLELKDSDFECFKNQGGLELVLRSKRSFLHSQDRIAKALATCTEMELDGLVFLGDEMSMTQASMVTEYFMSRNSKTCVVGVPVAGGNSLGGDLIEACVGFDTNARIYASLVGNVLTDAISMPKYWHFVKILGRYPSIEVLECALQTHPNVVIIAEEYKNSDKTLFDIVEEIANAVVKRSKLGKNFGTVLIPDHLVLHLPNTKNMLQEISRVINRASQMDRKKEAISQLMNYNYTATNPDNEFIKMITPWSLAVFASFPDYIRREILNLDFGEVALESLEIEVMLAKMVKEELAVRQQRGEYSGNYAAVTHYFGYQGRCAMPSEFDCSLAFAYGHLAAICVQSKLSGFCCSIRAVCGAVKDWKLFATPFTCMMKIAPDSFKMLINPKSEVPIIPSNSVNLNGKAFKKLKSARKKWLIEDLFNNPGPIQFNSFVCTQNIMLIIEHSQYYHMITSVERFTEIIKNLCKFGVSEEYLNHAFIQLWGLIKITQDKNQLISLSQDFKLL